ncbi:restriction endonuclease [Reichenbachiella ulvae]|uniref:Restriction endonuclease n=1 Tax=Reichenbachiella ulvae TaxID=2980104 RepID=A0ABT3CP05_9BACT|nr:restriction endonuclease [Reichenbachiella ulvae]MCV9385364.1 restriction endonuclease [Reichenbachiella ulvae]
MNKLEESIEFQKINHSEFEEICFELLMKLGFSGITWRKGAADDGRDIEAYRTIDNNLVEAYKDKFFIECKHFTGGVPPEKLYSKIAWADAEKPNHLVLILTSHLTNSARTWLERIEKDKSYKIHLIEGHQIKKLISQHDDLIKKYFLKNDSIELLNEIKKNWLIHNLVPSFSTWIYIFENLEMQVLTMTDKVFLYLIYYSNYSKMEELENRVYHGIEVESIITELEQEFLKNGREQASLLANLKDIDTLSDEGALVEQFDEEVHYDFMTTEMLINSKDRNNYRLAIYCFKRLKDNMAIELLMDHNSNFDFQIRLINPYTFEHYENAVRGLNFYKTEYEDRVIDSSLGMR